MNIFDSATLRQMQALSQAVSLRGPRFLNAEATVGELAWGWGKDVDTLGPYWRCRIWETADNVAAWGWVVLPYKLPRSDGMFRTNTQAKLIWQVHPDMPDLIDDVFGWFDQVAETMDQVTILQSGDSEARRRVENRGFVLDEEDGAEDGNWTQMNTRSLVDIPAPVLPDGYRFLSATDVPRFDAVKVHQAAWGAPIFTESSLARLEQTWPYRQDLHVLIQAPDGKVVATAIVWFDNQTGIAEFEPVGTHPDYRRKGLGRALQLHGMHKAKEAGANRMLVACLGGSAHPAAKNLYRDVGFSEISRDIPMIRFVR